jgi:zinc protease
VVYGDAARVNTDLAKLQAVTTAEIKEVLNRYITGKKKVIVEYLPETMKPGFVPPPSDKKEKKP